MSNALTIMPQNQPSLFPTEQELKLIKEQAVIFIRSGLLPSAIKTPEQAILIALKGRELGVPMLQSLSHLHVINGKVGMSAELMLQQVYRLIPDADIEITRTDAQACEIEAGRPGKKKTKFTFTIEDARRAGLLNNPTWQKYPATMLRWRCTSVVAKAVFPDAIAGCYTPEELGAEVDQHGNVVSVPKSGSDKADELNAALKKPEPVEVEAEPVADETKSEGPKATDPADYVIPAGPHEGKALKSLPLESVRAMESAFRKAATRGPLTGLQLEAQGKIQAYLEAIPEEEDQGAFGSFQDSPEVLK